MEPNADTNLLKPARGTVPSPLRVSTMDELEYGSVVLRFGRDLPTAAPKVYCKGITVKVPTGRSGTDLTIEPSLITTAVSKVVGEAQGTEWHVDRNTTDPNVAVFSFVPDTTALFDGTWAVSFTLSGIEVNPSIGTVDLDIEEMTSTTGPDDGYQKRTGQVQVKKGNDEFFFRGLRPRTVVVNRGSTADLLWEAPADPRITYTMYYRKADGTEAMDGNQANFAGRVWKSPALDDNANFTLKATLDGQDYFLTTYLTVNNPNVVVNTLSAKSNVTVDPGVDGYIWLKSGRFDTTAEATLNLYGALNANGDVTVAAAKTLTANGPVQANGNVTVAAAGTLTTNGPVQANGNVTVKADKTLSTGDVTIDKDRTLTVSWVDPTVTNGTITARGNVTVATGKTLTTNGPVQANGNITVDPGATGYIWLKTGRLDTAAAAAVNLHGSFTGTSVSASSMAVGGKRVVRNGDRIALSNSIGGGNFIYHASNASQWDNVVARPGNTYENTRWTVVSEAGNFASNDEVDVSDPTLPVDPEADSAGPGTSSV